MLIYQRVSPFIHGAEVQTATATGEEKEQLCAEIRAALTQEGRPGGARGATRAPGDGLGECVAGGLGHEWIIFRIFLDWWWFSGWWITIWLVVSNIFWCSILKKWGCHPNPIDFHSIIFQDGEIAPPTRLVYGTEKKFFFRWWKFSWLTSGKIADGWRLIAGYGTGL